MRVNTKKPVESSTNVLLTKAKVKVALIAVANKLIKQCFAIAKSGRPYVESYVFVLPK